MRIKQERILKNLHEKLREICVQNVFYTETGEIFTENHREI